MVVHMVTADVPNDHKPNSQCFRMCVRWITGLHANYLPAPFNHPFDWPYLDVLRHQGCDVRHWKRVPSLLGRPLVFSRKYWIASFVNPDDVSQGHAVVMKGGRIVYDCSPLATARMVFGGRGTWIERKQ